MLHPKFIIEDDCLILSKVSYHNDLVTDKTKVKGGGMFRYLTQTDTFLFYGISFDFGEAKIKDIIKCIKEGKVFTNKYKTHDISNKHHFAYDMGYKIIVL